MNNSFTVTLLRQLLPALLLTGVFPWQGLQAQGPGGRGPFPSSEEKENPGLRDRFSKHFILPDGSMKAYISSGSVHYRDARGKWQDIDCNLHPSSVAGYVAENTTNSISSYYPATPGAATGLRLRAAGGEEVAMAITPRLDAFGEDGSLVARLQEVNATAAAEYSGNTLTYKHFFDQADNSFSIGPDQVKNNLVLTAFPGGFPQEAAFLAYTEGIRLPDGWTLHCNNAPVAGETITGGSLSIVDENGQTVFVIPVPDVFEQNNPSQTIHPDGRWEKAFRVKPMGQGNYELSTLVPADWLADQSRNYPVVIDPTVTLTGNYGGWQNTAASSLDGNPTIYVFTGLNTNTYRAYTRFDVSSIPNSAVVANTRLQVELNGTGSSATTETVLVNDVTGTLGPYGAYNASVYTDLGDGNYTSFTCSTTGTYGYYDLGTGADSDVMSSLSSDLFQVGFSIASPSTWKRFTSNLSYLEITYFTCTPVISASATSPTYANGFNIGCYGDTNGSISTTVTGGSGYTYTWEGPNGYTSAAANPSNLAAGTYYLTVYAAGDSCPDTLSITLLQPAELLIADTLSYYIGGKNVSCKGGNDGSIDIGITGSSGYTYSWTGPGGFTSTTQDLSGLGAGVYYLTVTESGNSCTVSDSFTLTEPLLDLYASILDAEDAYCANTADGTAEAGGAGGTTPYTYMWSNAQATASATGLSANTTYTITVSDVNGCTDTASVYIGAQHELPVVDLGPPDTGYCAGGNVLLNAGPGFLSYLWSDGSTGQILPVTSVGLYMVTVTAFSGCTNSDQINVNQEYALPDPDLGANVSTGTVPVTLDAGAYEAYFWNTGATTQTIDVYIAGTYTVTVTDNHGCKESDDINVSIWPTGITENGTPGFSVYPVPASDFITVSAAAIPDATLDLILLNTLGQPVLQQRVKAAGPLNQQLPVAHLPKGTYYLQLTGESVQWGRPVIIE